MDFMNKVVLIVGSNSGIGSETAKYMACRGADLSLQGSNEAALEKVASQCRKFEGQELLLTTGNLTDLTHVPSLIQRTVDKFGRLDVLINNTGIIQFGSVESAEILNQYDSVFNINVKPIISLISSAAPYLEETKGNIVNVSNMSGTRSLPNLLVYSMSKSSLDQLTRCAALDLAPKRIRVNGVSPATMDPPFCDESNVCSEVYFDKVKKFYPMGRMGIHQEVASVIGYLASEEASFITGTTIAVDGGRHCSYPIDSINLII